MTWHFTVADVRDRHMPTRNFLPIRRSPIPLLASVQRYNKVLIVLIKLILSEVAEFFWRPRRLGPIDAGFCQHPKLIAISATNESSVAREYCRQRSMANFPNIAYKRVAILVLNCPNNTCPAVDSRILLTFDKCLSHLQWPPSSRYIVCLFQMAQE